MQDGAMLCRPEFEEELVALLSIYDSELNVERKVDGSVSLKLKISPAPPAYIKASVTLHLPAAVRNSPAFHIAVRLLTLFQHLSSQNPSAQCDMFGPLPVNRVCCAC